MQLKYPDRTLEALFGSVMKIIEYLTTFTLK